MPATAFTWEAIPEVPTVGDERITFQVLKPGTFSFLARQSGDTLAPYLTHEGGEIERVGIPGTMGADVMFQARPERKHDPDLRCCAWSGFVMMWIGFALIFNPLHVLADVVPFIGGIVGFGTGLLAGLLAFAGSAGGYRHRLADGASASRGRAAGGGVGGDRLRYCPGSASSPIGDGGEGGISRAFQGGVAQVSWTSSAAPSGAKNQ